MERRTLHELLHLSAKLFTRRAEQVIYGAAVCVIIAAVTVWIALGAVALWERAASVIPAP